MINALIGNSIHGSIHHREFAMASGEMNEAEFVAFLTTSLRLLAGHSTNGSIHFVCMDWQHVAPGLVHATNDSAMRDWYQTAVDSGP